MGILKGFSFVLILFAVFFMFSSSVFSFQACPYNTKFCVAQCNVLITDYYSNTSVYNCTVDNLLTCAEIVTSYHASCKNGYPQYYPNGQLIINDSISNLNQVNENGTVVISSPSLVTLSDNNGYMKQFFSNVNTYIKVIIAILIIGGLVFSCAKSYSSNGIVLLFVALVGVILTSVLGLIPSGILILMIVILLVIALLGIFVFKGSGSQ